MQYFDKKDYFKDHTEKQHDKYKHERNDKLNSYVFFFLCPQKKKSFVTVLFFLTRLSR